MTELHTYIECSRCGASIRPSRHTLEECKKAQQKNQEVKGK